MDFTEEVRAILLCEENGCEWALIEHRSNEVLAALHAAGAAKDFDNTLYQYLEDYDVRQNDPGYAAYQRDSVAKRLDKL